MACVSSGHIFKAGRIQSTRRRNIRDGLDMWAHCAQKPVGLKRHDVEEDPGGAGWVSLEQSQIYCKDEGVSLG